MSAQTKFLLDEDKIPQAWYNLRADLPFQLPPVLHPGTKQPVGPDDLAPLFPQAIIEQEVTTDRWVEIPEAVRDVYAYDYGDTGKLTPLVKMYTLGHGFVPEPIHAGGLRYHGMASSICELYRNKLIEARAVPQLATFEAGVLFARTEGILPAPEAAHAVRGAMDEAIRCREEGRGRTILFNLCGHGHFDLSAYEKFHAGQIKDFDLPQDELDRARAELPEA